MNNRLFAVILIDTIFISVPSAMWVKSAVRTWYTVCGVYQASTRPTIIIWSQSRLLHLWTIHTWWWKVSLLNLIYWVLLVSVCGIWPIWLTMMGYMCFRFVFKTSDNFLICQINTNCVSSTNIFHPANYVSVLQNFLNSVVEKNISKNNVFESRHPMNWCMF